MRILLVGNGGREHALAHSMHRSPLVDQLFFTAGNPGIKALAEPVNLGPLDIPELATWAKENRIDLTVVGPEAPLTHGIVDHFQKEGLTIFGPSQAAAQLEGSKVFSKGFMHRHGIPTAAYRVCDSPEEALQCIDEMGSPLVVKADGLAAGKGVIVCQTLEEARYAIEEVMVERAFGESGARVVLEEFLEGEEASLLAFVDGERALMMVPAQDHKAIFDGDQGPNTGGMGAYSPAPVVTPTLLEEIERTIVKPVIQGMAAEGQPYRGVLYVGLMITADGPKVIEFNCRFGDPETQAILPRLKSDIVPILLATAQGSLAEHTLEWDPQPCVSVVLASEGYPGSFLTGFAITGLDEASQMVDGMVFHAGTRRVDGQVVTAGGRVLSVSALGTTIDEAVERAYEAVAKIRFEGITYRRDIAHRALGGLLSTGAKKKENTLQ